MGNVTNRGERPLARLHAEAPASLLARFAMPVIAGMLVVRLCLVFDGILVGQVVGDAGVAAITAAAPFVTLLNALVMLVGDGAAALMALRFGADRRDGAEKVMGNALLLFAGLSVAMAVSVPWWATAALQWGGAEGAVLEEARIYLIIALAGTFALCFSLGVDTFLRVCGFPARTLAVQVVATVVNVGAGLLFVAGLGWGVPGAALATVLSQVGALVLTVFFLMRRDMPLRLRSGDFRPDRAVAGRILALGLPSFIVRSSDAAVALLINFLMAWYGAETVGATAALAAAGVVNRVSQFALVPAIGVAVGARPLLGFARGAADRARMGLLVRYALRAGTLALIVLWLGLELGAPLLAAVFGLVGEGADLATAALRISLGAMPILALRIVGTNYFQAIGEARKATVLTFCQQFVFLLPLIAGAPLVLPGLVGVDPLIAVFWGMFAADVASTALTAAFLAETVKALREGSAPAEVAGQR